MVSPAPIAANCWAVVLAAGKKSFADNQVPIPYLPLYGANVLTWACDTFLKHPSIRGVVVVLAQGDQRWRNNGVQSEVKPIWTTQGGEQRCHSVFAGLKKLEAEADENDWVLIHDAVRPCLALDDLDRLLHRLAGDQVGGYFARPIEDSVKLIEMDNEAQPKTVTGHQLWRTQTPQMFRYQKLKTALTQSVQNGLSPNDESEAMEHAGFKSLMTEGACDNIKLTCSQHLNLAEAILARRSDSSLS